MDIVVLHWCWPGCRFVSVKREKGKVTLVELMSCFVLSCHGPLKRRLSATSPPPLWSSMFRRLNPSNFNGRTENAVGMARRKKRKDARSLGFYAAGIASLLGLLFGGFAPS